MAKKPIHRRVREHPNYFLGLSILIGLLLGMYTFSFFSGIYPLNPFLGLPVHADPTLLSGLSLLSFVDLQARISQPPIIIVPRGTSPLTVTYNVFTNGNRTAYTWWYQWANSTVHVANIWEPVYIYYDITNVLAPSLVAIAVRFHFAFRLVYGGWVLNGTRPFISFSPNFFIPTVASGTIAKLLRPVNGTAIFDYPYTYDPSSPPATGPSAYQKGAGPVDPWLLLGGVETIQNGLVYGSILSLSTIILLNTIFSLTVTREAEANRIRIRRELLGWIIED